jgi:sugar phosphate isomerase/epimerase
MKTSVSTFGAFTLGIDEGLRAIAEAGFDAIDIGLDSVFAQKDTIDEAYEAYLLDENRIRETVVAVKEGLKKYGLTIGQAHAPSAYVPRKPRETEIMRKCVEKCFAICEELDCRHLVIHPICDGSARYPSLTKEDEIRENMAYFSSIIPLLKKHNIICCLENAYSLDWGTKKAYACACSDMAEANRYIDDLNALAGEKRFAFCLDTGHALMIGTDIYNAIKILGDRLEILHVHDNDGYLDEHTATFLGICNWGRFIKGLREFGYKGNINMETSSFVQLFPKELVPAALKLLAAEADYFRTKVQE